MARAIRLNCKLPALTAAVFTICFGRAAADSLQAQPGQWRITKAYASGSGYAGHDFGDPELRCVTQEDLADPGKAFQSAILVASLGGDPRTPQKETCNRTEFNETTNSVTYKLECKGEAYLVTRVGSIKFDSPTHYAGDFELQDLHYEDGEHTNMVMPLGNHLKSEGTRVGECAANSGRK